MIAGIDGGGTSTRLELRDAQNRLLMRQNFGAFNLTAVGEEAFRALIRQLGSAGAAQAERLCIGGAGISYGGVEQLIRQELEPMGFHGRLMLCTDCEIALRGAMDGPGCVLIAGTGAIGYGSNDKGKRLRCGGYGHLIDDGGSGYAIGRDALTLTVKTLDGRARADELADAVMNALGLRNAADLVQYVYRSNAGKAGVAKVAETVLQCAAQGELHSLNLLQRNAAELRQIIVALAQGLELEQPRTALLGGLISHDTCYRTIVQAALAGCAQVVEPMHDALWGAAQLAWEMQP